MQQSAIDISLDDNLEDLPEQIFIARIISTVKNAIESQNFYHTSYVNTNLLLDFCIEFGHGIVHSYISNHTRHRYDIGNIIN